MRVLRSRRRQRRRQALSAKVSGGSALTVQGLPLIKPPYSRITAIDLDKGEFRWQVPFGATPDSDPQSPRAQGFESSAARPPGQQLRDAGDARRCSSLVKATIGPTPQGQRGAMLRAFDKATGKEVGAVYHARATKRLAHDLSDQRQAVHGRGHQRRFILGRAGGVQAAVKNPVVEGGQRTMASSKGALSNYGRFWRHPPQRVLTTRLHDVDDDLALVIGSAKAPEGVRNIGELYCLSMTGASLPASNS